MEKDWAKMNFFLRDKRLGARCDFFTCPPYWQLQLILRHVRLSYFVKRERSYLAGLLLPTFIFLSFYSNRKVKTPQHLPPKKVAMKIIQSFFAIVCIVASTNACIVLDAIYSSDTGAVKGTLLEDDVQTCTLAGTVDRDAYHFTCIKGYSASFIRKDLAAVTYRDNNGRTYQFQVQKYQADKSDPQYKLSARMFC
jgi:hypothetical protein